MSGGTQIEKQWITPGGLQAIVVVSWEQGKPFRRGYVGVPAEHPLCGKQRHKVAPFVDVHGGLAFAGSSEEVGIEGSSRWWFGFDASPRCGIMDENAPWRVWYGLQHQHRSLEYVVEQCEYLARQLCDLGELWRVFPESSPASRCA